MSVYKTLLEKAENGSRFKINLNKKNLVIGRKIYIKDGECCVDDYLITAEDLKELGVEGQDFYEVVKQLYKRFKYSVPSENENRNYYFSPLPFSDLTDGDLAYGEPRHLAQAMLEGFILIAGLCDMVKWKNESYWFWQDENEKDLIIMKNWITKTK